MKKISLFSLIFILVLSFSNSTGVFAIKDPQNLNELITVSLIDQDSNPVPDTYVTLYSLTENSFVFAGTTDNNGTITLNYEPHFGTSSDNIINIDFAVYAAPKNTELLTYHFTQTFIKEKTGYTDNEVKSILSDNTNYIELVAKEILNVNTKIDSRDSNIRDYLIKTGKLSPQNPIHKINGQDRRDMLLKGILSLDELSLGKEDYMSRATDIVPLADATHDLGSFITTIGEVHSIDGVSTIFKFSKYSAVKIDVATKTGSSSSWGVSGSLKKEAGWDVVWPTFSTTSTSGFGKQARTYFKYNLDETMSYWSGNITYSVYASTFNGGAVWGNSIYGLDGASVSSITSNSLGSDWASYLPNATTTYTVSAGRSYGGAATISVPKLSSSVTVGAITSYNSNTTITYKFASGKPYNAYYVYGRGTGWKSIYVSNSSR